MTKLCGSCGEELLDSDRFCDRCGAAQPTRPPQRESYRQPTESVPRTELDSLKATLEARIGDLEAKLAVSVPRREVDTLRVKLRQLESLLAASIPRREAKAEADSLRARIALLQDNLAELVPKAELEDKVNELATANEAIEDLRGQLSQSSAKIDTTHRIDGLIWNFGLYLHVNEILAMPLHKLETLQGAPLQEVEMVLGRIQRNRQLDASPQRGDTRHIRAEFHVL